MADGDGSAWKVADNSSKVSSNEAVESGDEAEAEEEVEPQLKYERVGNDLTKILSRDAASCLAVHSKFIALGTHWGVIHILDILGNNIRSKDLPSHSLAVNQISIDDNGDYLASCSDDGKVIINGLYTLENNNTVNFNSQIKAVALDPQFYKSGSGKHFVTGDDKLILYEKTFLNRHKTILIHQGEGPIKNIQWKGTLIAWSNEKGVKIFDMTERKRITFIERIDRDVRTDLCRCNLCWKDETTLLIGWARSIQVCQVRTGVRSESDPNLLTKRAEIVYSISVDYLVCGIAPLGDNIVILSYSDNVSRGREDAAPERPHLRLHSISEDDEISNDALSIRGFQEYRCNDYHLESLPEEGTYFIVSPRDVVCAKLRDADDHVQWLIEHEMFIEAMDAASEHGKTLKKFTHRGIGLQYFGHLLKEGDYDEAGSLCKNILGKSKELWEEHIACFEKENQLMAIAKYMPLSDPILDTSVYEKVLLDFLQNNHEQFYHHIKTWPFHLYRLEVIVNAILDKLDRDRNNKLLLESLGQLYTYSKRFDRALYIYMSLGHENIFDLILEHNLFNAVSDRIVTLMEFNKEAAVKMLLDNTDKIPVAKVVNQLGQHMEFLHNYLDHLFRKDQSLCEDYGELQVRLYAEFDRPKLMQFLRSSNHIPLQKALDECQQRSFHPEMVFLLGRMGNTKQALQLITTELDDVSQAIEFCKEHNDTDLWEDLISFSIDKPTFITGLLNSAGTHIDPIILIKKIRKDLEIPGLRNSLVQILHDYYLQISLQEGCKKILISDCANLMQKLVRVQKKGISIDDGQKCQGCNGKIITRNLQLASDVVVFYCHHTYHEDCLPAHGVESCPICSVNHVRRPSVSVISRRPASLASQSSFLP